MYVTSPKSYLARDGDNVVLQVEGSERFRVPVHNLEGIVCFSFPGASPALLGLCCEKGVSICFLSRTGRFLARVSGRVTGNVLLRRRQYKLADDMDACCSLSSSFVAGKILNSRSVLLRFARDHRAKPGVAKVLAATDRLLSFWERLANCTHVDSVRGLEGDAAREYYSVFDYLITAENPVFRFGGRTRRPPLDVTNALLSFLYSILAYECASALESVGLDPQVGFLHRDRPGRLSLALDLMEELRPYLADRFVLTMLNNGQVSPKGFLHKESGAVLMDDVNRKTILSGWQKRKQEEITHPFLEKKIKVGLIPYAQALLLARFLRGDLDDYPPFLVR